MAKDYYKEINDALISYEEFKSYHQHSIDWITDRIDWCWKFRKITKDQMEELCDRVIKIIES